MPGIASYPLRLVADVGGTHLVFAVTRPDGLGIDHMTTFMSDDLPGLGSAIARYLEQLVGPQPREAALAVAAPVLGDHVTLTNRAWSFSGEQLRRELGFDRVVLLNDFEA